jgi:hypothetical protein
MRLRGSSPPASTVAVPMLRRRDRHLSPHGGFGGFVVGFVEHKPNIAIGLPVRIPGFGGFGGFVSDPERVRTRTRARTCEGFERNPPNPPSVCRLPARPILLVGLVESRPTRNQPQPTSARFAARPASSARIPYPPRGLPEVRRSAGRRIELPVATPGGSSHLGRETGTLPRTCEADVVLLADQAVLAIGKSRDNAVRASLGYVLASNPTDRGDEMGTFVVPANPSERPDPDAEREARRVARDADRAAAKDAAAAARLFPADQRGEESVFPSTPPRPYGDAGMRVPQRGRSVPWQTDGNTAKRRIGGGAA